MLSAVVFTDLDGTLLNHHDYSWQAAAPAIERLRRLGIPLILVSSKTRAEMAELCRELQIDDPYICENGSLMVFPKAWVRKFQLNTENLTADGEEYLGFFGANREHILAILEPLKQQFAFTGFADMTVDEVMHHTGLSEEAAVKAMQRAASEPLLWQDEEALLDEFAQQLRAQQLRVLRGGRFFHVMADCDKGDAVRYLLNVYARAKSGVGQSGAAIHSIALGDSPNDREMLRVVDQAVIIPHSDGSFMRDNALGEAIRAPYEGAKGWRAGIEIALERLQQEEKP